MIVAAFAAGDRVTLRALLADDTYAAFEQAITARETAGETQVSEIKAMQQLAIERGGAEGPERADHRRGSCPTRSAIRRTRTGGR